MAYLTSKPTIPDDTTNITTTAAGHIALHNNKASAVNSLGDEMIDARNPDLDTPEETADSVPHLLGMLKQMIANITGETNWWDAVAETISSLKSRLDTLTTNVGEGWKSAGETWTYASASTITVPTGAASKYGVGDKIKWTQTTVKYGVITAVADTLLTIAVNTDYVVTNAAISANYYSHADNPLGFPARFAFTPAYTNLTVGAGANVGYYSTYGRRVKVWLYWVFGAGAAVGSSPLINNLPIAIANVYAATGNPLIGHINVLDSGTANFIGTLVRNSANVASLVMQTASGTYLQDSSVSATVPMTWATNDSFNGYLEYSF